MFKKICKWWFVWIVILTGGACDYNEFGVDDSSGETGFSTQRQPLSSNQFALPVGGGYNWEVTQSWGEHCKKCDDKYPTRNGELSYCESSHTGSTTKYGWDFNLPGNADKSRSVLASADGVVKKLDTTASGDWGNYVIIDHGDNICTRYAHLLDGSITVSKEQQVCQGLKIGEIGKTGNSTGYHLHFQFEACDNLNYGIDHGFDDGNGKPMCVMGSDIYSNGVYTALKFNNTERISCGWKEVSCGSLNGCPMSSACDNKGKPSFGDFASLDSLVAAAVGYLWQECAISGKSDGKFYAGDNLTRAEGLKIALQTFGLVGNCKASEPFEDVKPSDWFYPYVLCGVKHGLIETIYTGFTPNRELAFSEAAKLAVESAKKAGKIEIKFPSQGHFSKDKLPITHWAYKYLETVYFYGGITSAMLAKDPYDKVTRGEYAVMVAALSPCFCSSVKCGSGCSCNQEIYSCGQNTVQASEPVGVHVAGSEGGQSGGQSPPSCQPYCYNKQCGPDGCGGNCGTCASGQFCNNQYGKCEYGCSLPSCASVGYECGNYALATQGCEGTSIICGSCPAGKNCVGGKCVQSAPPQAPGFNCDQAKGYTIFVYSPGGSWQALASPNMSYYSGALPNSSSLSLKFYCSELPGAALINGGPNGVYVWLEDNTLPNYALWSAYSGGLTLNPPFYPDVVTSYFFTPTPNTTLLVRVPSQ